MSMSDPIADMLTRIRNAQMVEKPTVTMPSSKLKVAIAQVLKDEGYIDDFAVRGEAEKPELEIALKYYAGQPVIENHRARQPPGPAHLQGPARHSERDERSRRCHRDHAEGRDDRPQGASGRDRRRSALLRVVRGEIAMSRVGKMPLALPKGVDVHAERRADQRQGLHGNACPRNEPLVTIRNENGRLLFAPKDDSPEADAMSGTMRALVANMVGGVTAGFEKQLALVGRRLSRRGTGQQAEPAGRLLASGLEGHAGRHQGRVPVADGDRHQGSDRQVVGQVAAEVRALPPAGAVQGQGHPLRR